MLPERNRLENLEAAIGSVSDTEDAQKVIEERFVAIETSVEYINKSIDEGINPSLKKISEAYNGTSKDVVSLQTEVQYLQNDVSVLKEDNKNPLAN
jgi:polyhydroxyalkanoate synthesis regulator phasin